MADGFLNFDEAPMQSDRDGMSSVKRTGGSSILRSHVVDGIFCVAREAVTNAYRHSGASRIIVELDYQEREFKMSCRDDGRGFDAEAFRASQTNGH